MQASCILAFYELIAQTGTNIASVVACNESRSVVVLCTCRNVQSNDAVAKNAPGKRPGMAYTAKGSDATHASTTDLDKEKVRTSVPGAVLSEGAIMPYPALDCTYPAHYPCCPALLPHSSYHPALDRRTLARVQEVCDAVASIRRTVHLNTLVSQVQPVSEAVPAEGSVGERARRGGAGDVGRGDGNCGYVVCTRHRSQLLVALRMLLCGGAGGVDVEMAIAGAGCAKNALVWWCWRCGRGDVKNTCMEHSRLYVRLQILQMSWAFLCGGAGGVTSGNIWRRCSLACPRRCQHGKQLGAHQARHSQEYAQCPGRTALLLLRAPYRMQGNAGLEQIKYNVRQEPSCCSLIPPFLSLCAARRCQHAAQPGRTACKAMPACCSARSVSSTCTGH
eukprot:1161782-Pelagomonas_calceolata.AAC.19